jgi:hypothetical protein
MAEREPNSTKRDPKRRLVGKDYAPLKASVRCSDNTRVVGSGSAAAQRRDGGPRRRCRASSSESLSLS